MATILEDRDLLIGDEAVTKSIWPTALQYGLISTVVGFALTLLFYNLGMMDLGDDGKAASFIPSVVSYVIVGVVAYLGVRAFRDAGVRSYLPTVRGIKWSAAFGLVAGLLSLVLMYLFFTLIAPEFLDQVRYVAELAMEDQGLSSSDIEAAQDSMGMFMGPAFFTVSAAVGSFFLSFIAGSIMTLFLKTE